MTTDYKSDVLEKVLHFFAMFYFIFGLFNTFAWGCTKLDQLSSKDDILSFWQSVSIVYGVFNIINIGAILYCINQNQKYTKGPLLVNEESYSIYNILCIPLFLISVLYLCWELIKEFFLIDSTEKVAILVILFELLFFGGSMSLMTNLSRSRINMVKIGQYRLNNLVLLITLIGVINYGIFHIVVQQVKIFIMTAANTSVFKKYYPEENNTLYSNEVYFNKVQMYIQPIVILFCYCCTSYIITLLYANNEELRTKEDNIEEEKSASKKSLEGSETFTIFLTTKQKSFNLPPIALLLGIIFITIIITMFLIVISLTTDVNADLRNLGKMIITIFPNPICALSVPLLCLQIHAMRIWPKHKENKNIVDKILLWIGVAGLLIVAIAEIKSHLYISNSSDSPVVLTLFMFLILNCLFQSITIALALDRKWKRPLMKSWQSYLCPNFAMFCINLAFFFMAIYSCRRENSISGYQMETEQRFYLKLFNEGFYSLGITLVIITRLHATIIFGKMAFLIA